MPNFLIEILFPILVVAVMFGLGLSLSIDDFKRVVIKPKATIVALTSQFIFLPILALLLIKLFSLKPELAVGFMIVAAAPGGVISNVLTLLLKGDTALSITLTALSSIIAIITIPFWVSLALTQFTNGVESVPVPVANLVLPVATLTLIPLGLGLFIRNRSPAFANNAKSTIRMGSGIFIFVGITAFLIDQGENLLANLTQAGLAAATLCISTALLGYGTARLFKLSHRVQGTIAIETGIQNIPLSMTIAITILGSNPLFAIAPAAYGLIMVIVMSIILIGIYSFQSSFQFSSGKTESAARET